MSEIVTGIRLRGDASGLVSETQRARTAQEKFTNTTRQSGNQAQRTSAQVAGLSAAKGQLTANIRTMFSPVNLLTGGIAGLIAAMGIGDVIRFSDEMKRLDNQVRLITKSEKERVAVQKELLQLSNRTFSDIAATTELFAKMTRATKDLNVSQNQLLAVTRAVNQSFVISGASTQEAEGSTRQLAQALASGAFRGDEFNSVAEQAPRLMEALSTQLGVTTGDLREMAANGELTSQKLIAALINQSDAINAEFGKMAPTASQAMTVVSNNFKTLVSEVNKASNDFGGLTNTISGIGEALGSLTSIVASGEMVAYLSAYAGAWSGWADSVFDSIDLAIGAVNQFPLQVLAAKAITEETLGLLADAFKYFPQNIKGMVQILTVELANLERVAKTYAGLFRDTVLLELQRLIKKAGAYASELVDVLNPFDGDAFDLSGELSSIDGAYDKVTEKAKANANARIAASNQARDQVLQDIFAERDGAISAMNEQLAAAKSLAEFRLQRPAANDNSFSAPEPFVPEERTSTPEEQNSEYEKLRLKFATREEALRINAQNEMAIIAEAMEQKRITEQQGLDLIFAARKKHEDELAALEAAKRNMILGSSAQIFDGLASITGAFAGKQSKAYKVLFAISKGFAIAQGVMNLSTAVSNAMALPYPLNIPEMAKAAATGASLIANIKGVTMQGQAHGGLDKNVREGTWWLRNDEMVLNPQQRRSFESMVASNDSRAPGGRSGGSRVFYITNNIDATNAVPGMEEKIRESVEMAQLQWQAQLREDFSNGGELSQSLSGTMAA
ncbi:tape measure protein [Alteromonas macleodii]|uniref:tape measure protein n=1 Tax=Alteromonas macleodii TaxID=28108 RepID=UPI003D08D5F2